MFLLVVLFIVVPIAELYVIIQVGEAIGVWPTLALLLLDAILGSLLLKHQGRGAWRRFNEALAARRFPGKEVADGLLIVIGGTLLLAPGFLTDIVGLFLLIPPTRAIARAVLKRFTIGRFTVVGVGGASGASTFGGGSSGPGGGANRHYDYDATAEEVPTNGNGAGRELPRIDED
ncbi:MAG TPA: FxsA family protein [Solirubrobacterales bacterium]|nr:FxsA family protein [Solirubrobacterales bacterium]